MKNKKLKKVPVKFLSEFKGFIKEYSLISLAIAFILGASSKELFQSLVDNLIMPFFNPLVKGSWETATLNLGPIALNWGLFVSTLLNFVLLTLVIFLVIKKLLKWEKK